jgi:hypothetical protein
MVGVVVLATYRDLNKEAPQHLGRQETLLATGSALGSRHFQFLLWGISS